MDSVLLADAMSTVLTLLQGPWSPVQLREHHHTGTGQRQTLQSVNYACNVHTHTRLTALCPGLPG